MNNFSVSQHAKERYAERARDLVDKSAIGVWVAQNEERIVNDISKMIEHGELLYSGVSTSATQSQYNQNDIIDIYLNGLWVVILNKNKNQVITLYPIDLGIDDYEMNTLFTEKLKSKIHDATEYYEEVKQNMFKQQQDLKAQITENENAILNYKKLIQGLEDYNTTSRELIQKLNIQLKIAENGIRELICKLIGRKSLC